MRIYDKTDMRYKYQTDSKFKSLVDLFESFLHRADYTPSEVREAAMLASIHYEMTSLKRMYIASPRLEIELHKFHEIVDEELSKANKGGESS